MTDPNFDLGPNVDPLAGSVPIPPDDEERDRTPARAVPLSEIDHTDRPRPILVAYGHPGAVAVAGCVTVLAGEGGVAKSALALTLALGMAALSDYEHGDIGRMFHAPAGSPVLLATWEDAPAVTAWRARHLARILDDGEHPDAPAHAALGGVHLLEMRAPLFGPVDAYQRRPVELDGLKDLRAAAWTLRPALVIVDPALDAYVGEANGPAPVREFIRALARLGAEIGAGVLLVAHSTKEARRAKDFDLANPGHVGGSAAWFDAARGVLTLTRAAEGRRILTIAKANYGPAYLSLTLNTLTAEGGAVVGFEAADTWEDSARVERRLRAEAAAQDKADKAEAANGHDPGHAATLFDGGGAND